MSFVDLHKHYPRSRFLPFAFLFLLQMFFPAFYSYAQNPPLGLLPLYSVNGVNAGDVTGAAIACLKDFRAVGSYSIAVGSPGFSPGGKVQVRDGASGSIVELDLNGSVVGAQMGKSLASVGDVGGSTLNDLLIGSPSLTTGVTSQAEVYFGPGVFGYNAGASTTDDFGTSVAGLFDAVLNPGILSILLGTPRDTGNTGQIFVNDSVGSPISQGGIQTFEEFGFSIASIADLSNDGRRDLMAGAPGANSGSGELRFRNSADFGNILVVTGENVGDRFGTTATEIPDVDGNGLPNFLVGAPKASAGVANGGFAKLYTFINGVSGNAQMLCNIRGAAGDEFGSTVADLGDVDGDGLDDFAIGAPGFNNNTGRVYIYTYKTSVSNCVLLGVINGNTPGDKLGIAIAGRPLPNSICDLNNDARADIGVGASTQNQAGKAVFYSVSPPIPTPTPTPTAIIPSTSNLTYKIFRDGRLDIRVEYNVAPQPSCSLNLYGRRSRADLSSLGPVRILAKNKHPSRLVNHYRSTGIRRAVCADDQKPFSFHIIAESTCSGVQIFSNVFARQTSCGLSPPLSIQDWERDFMSKVN